MKTGRIIIEDLEGDRYYLPLHECHGLCDQGRKECTVPGCHSRTSLAAQLITVAISAGIVLTIGAAFAFGGVDWLVDAVKGWLS